MSKRCLYSLVLAFLAFGAVSAAGQATYDMGALAPFQSAGDSKVWLQFLDREVLFRVEDPLAAYVHVRIADASGRILFDSGLHADTRIGWDRRDPDGAFVADGTAVYTLRAWDSDGQPAGAQMGEIDFAPQGLAVPLAVALGYDAPGNFTIGGYLGVGTQNPARAVHIVGSNAVFRMDRNQDSAAFMLVRTDGSGNAQKTFVVGVNSSGANQGEFVINDLGANVSGSGSRRLTIDTWGNATFTGNVTAQSFISSSSANLKCHIQSFTDAVETLMQLRGVRFNWKSTGEPSIGFIAEEVDRVLPEVVARDADGNPSGLDYSKLTAVLVEAAKSQQGDIEQLKARCQELQARWEQELTELKSRLQDQP